MEDSTQISIARTFWKKKTWEDVVTLDVFYKDKSKAVPVIGMWCRNKQGHKYYEEETDLFSFYFYVPVKEENKIYTMIDEYKPDTIELIDYKGWDGEKLIKLNYNYYSESKIAAARTYFDKTYEADIKPRVRYHLDNEIKYTDKRRICYFDIENEMSLDTINTPEKVISIAVYDTFSNKYGILVLDEKLDKPDEKVMKKDFFIVKYKHEVNLLEGFAKYVEKMDFDILSAYNLQGFDWPYLCNRARKLKCYGFNNISPIQKAWAIVDEEGDTTRNRCYCGGRELVDYYVLVKKLIIDDVPENYKLDTLGSKYLNKRKVKSDKYKNVLEMYKNDINIFIKYNVQDVVLIKELDDKFKFLSKYLLSLQKIVPMPLDNILKNSMVWDFRILKRYNKIKVFPSKEKREKEKFKGAITGALEMLPNGEIISKAPPKIIYHNVAVYDFASLYPSIIKTFNLSPDTITMIGMPNTVEINGVAFDQDKPGLIVELLDELMNLRSKYKKGMEMFDVGTPEYIDNYNLQYAVKVLNNSLYGSLSLPTFRLYDLRVASAITEMGQRLIKEGYKSLLKVREIVYGDSVGKDSKIILENNETVTIEEYWDKYTKECDIILGKERKKCNMKILTCDENYKNIFIKPKEIIRHKVNKKMFKVTLTNMESLILTEDHGLISIDPKTKKYIEVSPKDNPKYILYNRKIPLEGNISIHKKELFPLAGFLIGNGYLAKQVRSKKYNYVMLSSNYNQDIIKNIIDPVCDIYKCNYTKRSNGFDISINCTELAEQLKYMGFGGSSITKSIPKFLFEESEENICNFLKGYFSADGSVSFRNESTIISSTSINDDLSWDIKKLLAKVGVASSIFSENNKTNYKGKESKYYIKKIIILDKYTFSKKIGFYTPVNDKIKNEKDNEIQFCDISEVYKKNVNIKKYSLSRKNNIINPMVSDFKLRKIKSIEEIEYTDYVYDFCIPNNERFYANEILVHNTDSIFVIMKETGIDESNKEIKIIQDIINEHINKYVEDLNATHNYLFMDAEKRFSSLMFLGVKKRYIGYADIWKGKWLDKQKFLVKGFDLVRREMPMAIKETIKHVIKMILERKSTEDIRSYYVLRKKEMKEMNVKQLAWMKGLSKNVEEYTKVLPSHVKACMTGKQYLGVDFVKGDYPKMMYVKGLTIKLNNTNKVPIRSDVIAFENDTVIPNNIMQILDYDRFFTAFIDNKLRMFDGVKGVDVEKIIRKNVLLSEFFK